MTCLWSQTALAMPQGEQALESIAPDPLPGLCWILAEVRPPGEGLEHTCAPPRIRPWVCVCLQGGNVEGSHSSCQQLFPAVTSSL